jgi:hypothetical protein
VVVSKNGRAITYKWDVCSVLFGHHLCHWWHSECGLLDWEEVYKKIIFGSRWSSDSSPVTWCGHHQRLSDFIPKLNQGPMSRRRAFELWCANPVPHSAYPIGLLLSDPLTALSGPQELAIRSQCSQLGSLLLIE